MLIFDYLWCKAWDLREKILAKNLVLGVRRLCCILEGYRLVFRCERMWVEHDRPSQTRLWTRMYRCGWRLRVQMQGWIQVPRWSPLLQRWVLLHPVRKSLKSPSGSYWNVQSNSPLKLYTNSSLWRKKRIPNRIIGQRNMLADNIEKKRKGNLERINN